MSNLDPILIQKRNPGTGQLSQGDAASAYRAIRGEGQPFDVVVLCAEEFQVARRSGRAPGRIQIICAPNDDAILNPDQIKIAANAARQVALVYAEGRKVLVTCMQGRNRSGLVTALAIHMLYGASGQRAARIVVEKRKGARALTNPNFLEFLHRIPTRPEGRVCVLREASISIPSLVK